jgi:ubiquinone biosynthesis protein COQ9
MNTHNPAFADPRPKTRAELAREALLAAMMPEAGFDGWNAASLKRAAKSAGLSAGEVELYCPGGVLDLIETWSTNADDQARHKIKANKAARIRDKITQAVLIRLSEYDGHEEATERARARLMLPDALDRSARLIWSTSDMIWKAIGDTSTDANYYSKRAILSGVYASTLAIWISENNADKPRTLAFLDNRIEDVMRIEKAKARWRTVSAKLPNLTEIASKIRYGRS